MKRSLLVGLVIGIIAPVTIGAAVTWGASSDTSCWDEYNNRGTRMYRTVASKGVDLEDCSPGPGCFVGYDSAGRQNRLYVPYKVSPRKANCDAATTTTVKPPITTITTTTKPITPAPARFVTQPVGSALPSDAECASWVRPTPEVRLENAMYNSIRGLGANSTYPRVTGDFAGTTDEIIQWTACKWGIDEDWVRAQLVNESYWRQGALGDFTTDADACSPRFAIGTYPAQYSGDREHRGECPESVGLGQVRWLYHTSAFAKDNAVNSSAYNLDYTYAVWRECYEGRFGWLNDVERGATYRAGDAKGCLGVWFSGRWYTDAATGYMNRFDDTLAQRTWEQQWFRSAETSTPAPTTTVSTTPPTTTAVATTAPTTTAPATTAPTTTSAPTTTQPATTTPPTTTAAPSAPPSSDSGAFVEAFTGNTGLERFDTGMFHRDNHLVAQTSWTGDHDTNCGDPSTQRTIRRDRPADSFYMCRDHMMTSVGDTSGYSIAWFAPKQTFEAGTHTSVSWDVNVTDLGNRQWWEVSIVPVNTPFLATVDWLAETANIDRYDRRAIVVGKGPFGNDGNIVTNGTRHDPLGWQHVCGDWAVDAEGCGSKAVRRTFTVTDNQNGTVSVDFLGKKYTYQGTFPEQFQVYFKDHNYTPDKDGKPVGHTWHWDNIVVR